MGLCRLHPVYWTQMCSDSGMLLRLPLVYSTFQSSIWCSTDSGQWNGWWDYNSPCWRLINLLSVSIFWSYPSTSPQTLCHHSMSICTWTTHWTLDIPESTNASLSQIDWLLLCAAQTHVVLVWYTSFEMRQKIATYRYCGRCKISTLCEFRCLLIAGSR